MSTKTLEEQLKDVRDHAYVVADDQYMDERIRPLVRLSLPLIDMLSLLVQAKCAEPVYEYEVVDAHALSQRTKFEGWQVVESVQEDMPLYLSKQVQVPGNSYTTTLQEQVVGRQTRYLVRRPVDSPIVGLLAAAKDANANASACLEETKKLKDELAKMNTSFKQLQEQRDAEVGKSMEVKQEADVRVAAAEKKLLDMQATARTAEAQLAKIAFALGDLKMKEILGS